MYSLILMTAVASTGDASSFHWKKSSCQGCGGCGGVPLVYSVGCYGSATPMGCTGCYGCTGCTGYIPYSTSCYGCSGCFGSGWSCTGCCGGMMQYTAPVIMPMAEPAKPEAAKPEAEKKSPASLQLDLPADAKLYVDGRLIEGNGSQRTFSTPELPIGRIYYYDMRAEAIIDGRVVHEEQRVLVRGGEQLSRSFNDLIARAKKTAATTEIAKK